MTTRLPVGDVSQGQFILFAAQKIEREPRRRSVRRITRQDEIDPPEALRLGPVAGEMLLVALGEEMQGKVRHVLQVVKAPAVADLPAQGLGQGHAHPGAAAQDGGVPAQRQELLDLEILRPARGIKAAGPAVRGQHDAVLSVSCQRLGHRLLR